MKYIVYFLALAYFVLLYRAVWIKEKCSIQNSSCIWVVVREKREIGPPNSIHIPLYIVKTDSGIFKIDQNTFFMVEENDSLKVDRDNQISEIKVKTKLIGVGPIGKHELDLLSHPKDNDTTVIIHEPINKSLDKEITYKLNKTPVGKIKEFVCKGRHQYEQRANGEWVCSCGRKLNQ